MATKTKLKVLPCRCGCPKDRHIVYGNGDTAGCTKHFPVCKVFREMDNMEYVQWWVSQKEKND